MIRIEVRKFEWHCDIEGCKTAWSSPETAYSIVQTFHLILDHFIAVQITAQFPYPLTLLFPLMHFAIQ